MHTAADLADHAATSLSRYAADLRAAADPGCTSTADAVASTLAQDRADAVRDLAAIALAYGNPRRAMAYDDIRAVRDPATPADTIDGMAAEWRALRDRLDAA